jgi:hypothetical protein
VHWARRRKDAQTRNQVVALRANVWIFAKERKRLVQHIQDTIRRGGIPLPDVTGNALQIGDRPVGKAKTMLSCFRGAAGTRFKSFEELLEPFFVKLYVLAFVKLATSLPKSRHKLLLAPQ